MSFFFIDPAPSAIYTLSLHDALPISVTRRTAEIGVRMAFGARPSQVVLTVVRDAAVPIRSEEHTSELQSQSNLVCRLLLEKKKREMIMSRGGCIHTSPSRQEPTANEP